MDKGKADLRERQWHYGGASWPGWVPAPARGLRHQVRQQRGADPVDMEFSADDHPSDRELKHRVLTIYNHRLDERNAHKRFVIDYGLVEIKKHVLVRTVSAHDVHSSCNNRIPIAHSLNLACL